MQGMQERSEKFPHWTQLYKYVLIIDWLCPLYWKVTKVSATYVCALTLHTGL